MNFSELDLPYEVQQGIEHAGFTHMHAGSGSGDPPRAPR